MVQWTRKHEVDRLILWIIIIIVFLLIGIFNKNLVQLHLQQDWY